ncbi:MAG: agmatine deiminase family protein [Paludibacter sp.]
MITDNQTNTVYFSELLKAKESFQKIEQILEKHQINFAFLKDTKDIWARDYMPIQIDMNRFVQFRYEPSYLKEYPHLQSNPKVVCKSNGFTSDYSEINLDGGNIVKWTDRVILNDRVFSENPQYPDRKALVSEIGRKLNAEVIIIPQIKSEMTGHADGLVRFKDEKTIIGNNLNDEYKYWGNAMKKVIQEYGFKYIEMPVFDYKVQYKNKSMSAIGCYMNYLEIGNLIIFPVFELEGNKDAEALNLMSDLYPTKIIECININEIALKGGLMNCISWNIKE